MESYPIKTDYTAPPLFWIASNSNVYTVRTKVTRKSWHKRQESVNSQ